MKGGFKYRMGIEEQPIVLIDEIHDELRVALWNTFYIKFIEKYKSLSGNVRHYSKRSQYDSFFKSLYIGFNLDIDEYPEDKFFRYIKDILKSAEYFEVFHFLEKIIEKCESYNMPYSQEFYDSIQNKLQEWNSPYRFLRGEIVPISNVEEIAELKKVAKNAIDFHLETVERHLLQSIQHIKPKGDLRNSIKESISMVESIARLIAPSENTLGKALKKLEKEGKVDPLLNESNLKLYHYTNGSNGIRHALMENKDLSIEDARYFLISCSAFTNYLFEKGRKQGVFNKLQ